MAGIEICNESPKGIKPFYEAKGKKITQYFKLSDQIENAWKKKNFKRLVEYCTEQIDLAHDVIEAEKIVAKKNRERFSIINVSGFNRLAMYHERITKNYWECIAICEQAIESGQPSDPYLKRINRCKKHLSKLK